MTSDYSEQTSRVNLMIKRLTDALNDKDWVLAEIYAKSIMEDMIQIQVFCNVRMRNRDQ